jgi:hypothetical protein
VALLLRSVGTQHLRNTHGRFIRPKFDVHLTAAFWALKIARGVSRIDGSLAKHQRRRNDLTPTRCFSSVRTALSHVTPFVWLLPCHVGSQSIRNRQIDGPHLRAGHTALRPPTTRAFEDPLSYKRFSTRARRRISVLPDRSQPSPNFSLCETHTRAVDVVFHQKSILPRSSGEGPRFDCDSSWSGSSSLGRFTTQIVPPTKSTSFHLRLRISPLRSPASRPPATELTKEDWSGRPGSNRRRPAWEFSLEFYGFSFCGENLSFVFQSGNLFSDLSNFN